MTDWQSQLAADGYILLPGVFPPEVIEVAITASAAALAAPSDAVLAGDGPAYGARNFLQLWPAALDLVRDRTLSAVVRAALGPRAGVVRGLYFDKPPGQSWVLPWHRDLTIAVREHGAVGRFRKPTTKAGVPHVEAPADLLARMLTTRVHLDPMTPANGPLRVKPGTHRADADERPAVTLRCDAGDVLLMRPLLLHASGHCEPGATLHRRIVHFECAAVSSPGDGYEWHTFAPF